MNYIPAEGVRINPIDLLIKLAGTFVIQDTPNPNKSESNEFGTSWVTYLDFKKELGDSGEVFLRIEPGMRNTVTNSLSLFSGVNYNAHNNHGRPEIRQFWFHQDFFDKQFSLTAGKIEHRNYLDKSIYAGDDDSKFLATIFNRPVTVEWPIKYGSGINIKVSPKKYDFLEVVFNYFDAAAKWEELWSNNMYSFQVNLKAPHFFSDREGKQGGNYRFYSWLNARAHRMLLKPDENNYSNYGAGFSFDQSIADVFGVFGRIGWQRPDLVPVDGGATIEYSWSTGAQMSGEYWGRDLDVFGVAVGQLFPSDEYEQAGNPGSAEGHLELYYNFAFNKHLHISPDFQLIWDPDGVSKASEGDDDAIFVWGLRTHVDF